MLPETTAADLEALRRQYLADPANRKEVNQALYDRGFRQACRKALLDLWDHDAQNQYIRTESDEQYLAFGERADALVSCNPAYLLLRELDVKLDSLHFSVIQLMTKIAPFVRREPPPITALDIGEIRQTIKPLLEADMPHYRNALINILDGLTLAEAVLDKFQPGQADDPGTDPGTGATW